MNQIENNFFSAPQEVSLLIQLKGFEDREQLRIYLSRSLNPKLLPLEQSRPKSSLRKHLGQYYRCALPFGWLLLGRQKEKHQKRPENNLRPDEKWGLPDLKRGTSNSPLGLGKPRTQAEPKYKLWSQQKVSWNSFEVEHSTILYVSTTEVNHLQSEISAENVQEPKERAMSPETNRAPCEAHGLTLFLVPTALLFIYFTRLQDQDS